MHSDPSSRVGVGSVMAWMGNAPSLVSLVTTNMRGTRAKMAGTADSYMGWPDFATNNKLFFAPAGGTRSVSPGKCLGQCVRTLVWLESWCHEVAQRCGRSRLLADDCAQQWTKWPLDIQTLTKPFNLNVFAQRSTWAQQHDYPKKKTSSLYPGRDNSVLRIEGIFRAG